MLLHITMKPEYLGNKELLKLEKVAFLSSRKIAPASVLKCYDWAVEMRNAGKCVIGGFHSDIEKDVFDFLLKGEQPVIIVLSRSIYKVIPQSWQKALDEQRLLIVSLNPNAVRNSANAAERRNQFLVKNADEVVFGNIHEVSFLKELYEELISQEKKVSLLG